MNVNQKIESLLPKAQKDHQLVDAYWNRTQYKYISDVTVKESKPVLTDNGRLVESYRADWSLDDGIVDQVFYMVLKGQGLSAWHMHLGTVDRLTAISGNILLVLYDARSSSSTYKMINELRLSEHRSTTVSIPPGVWHGVLNTSHENSILLNCVDNAYKYDDPDHYRIPHDSEEIPYSFNTI